MRYPHIIPVFLLALLFLPVPPVVAQDTGDTVTRRGTVDDDYYAAGGTVDIHADIKGDVMAAGGTVTIGQRVSGDVMAGGGTVTIRAEVLDDVRAGGGDVTIDSRVADDLIVAGGMVKVNPDTQVGGNAWLAGGDVNMAGTVDHDLFIAADSTTLSGTVKGDVEIMGAAINILNGTHIHGKLTYHSHQKAYIHPDARIDGSITYIETDEYEPGRGYRILSFITLSVAGIVLYLLFPGVTTASAKRAAADFWKSLGLGFALLVTVPVAAMVAMVLVVGVWVGLPLIAIYLVALLVGYLVGAFFVADLGARLLKKDLTTTGRHIWALVAAILFLTLLRFIPIAGGLANFLLLLAGLGALTLHLYAAYSGAATPSVGQTPAEEPPGNQ